MKPCNNLLHVLVILIICYTMYYIFVISYAVNNFTALPAHHCCYCLIKWFAVICVVFNQRQGNGKWEKKTNGMQIDFIVHIIFNHLLTHVLPFYHHHHTFFHLSFWHFIKFVFFFSVFNFKKNSISTLILCVDSLVGMDGIAEPTIM